MNVPGIGAALLLGLLLNGCSRTASEPSLPVVTVHKSATCGCCKLWVDRLRDAGFPVEVRDVENLDAVKRRVAIPVGMGSCHTAEVGGYFVEGHVPVEDIERLLRERPEAKGITVPGMPVGSPGMESPSGRVDSFDVFLVERDGSTSVFSRHGPPEPPSR